MPGVGELGESQTRENGGVGLRRGMAGAPERGAALTDAISGGTKPSRRGVSVGDGPTASRVRVAECRRAGADTLRETV